MTVAIEGLHRLRAASEAGALPGFISGMVICSPADMPALRLAAFELLKADGATPVLLLDDVFAELDTARRAALAGVAESAEQVLITAAVPEDIPGNWAPKRITIDMADRLSVLVS